MDSEEQKNKLFDEIKNIFTKLKTGLQRKRTESGTILYWTLRPIEAMATLYSQESAAL